MRLSCCGDDCDRCPRYEATQNNDYAALEALAILWHELGWRDKILKAEDMQCNGCATVKSCGLGVRDCSHGKKLENCGECSEFPCRKMEEIIERSEENAKICREKCNPVLYEALNDSFFKKREYLAAINRQPKSSS